MKLEAPASLAFLEGGGEMGALIRAKDWSATPLGAVDGWPQSLCSALSICLGSRFPIVIYWGPACVVLYNDAYAEILGKKHPWALGRPCREVWSEIWNVIAPMLDGVLATGDATWSEDQLLILERRGYQEECYFSFSFSPVRGTNGRVDGIFTAVIENTRRVLSERRLRTLRDLGAAVAEAKSAEQACRMAANALAENQADVPFALLYLVDPETRRGVLIATAGTASEAWPARASFELDSSDDAHSLPLATVCRTGNTIVTGEQPLQVLVLPLAAAGEAYPAGALVAGVSPRRELDDEYTGFFELIARRITAAVADARAYEAERRRAEALAELDRAKTAFFSNVSHEFRTPLTLMLGPLEDLLLQRGEHMPAASRAALEVVQRNGRRLLKLVNTLLDFARIEAGRAQASYEPVDLAALTADLASNFRSACERAGLALEVNCVPPGELAYVDREMWEKIVLNLLSNAFKFTLAGGIFVSLRSDEREFVLEVRDTGGGIPAAELPRMFERFHRVEGARGRSYEGSGIGLALVQELVKLHGGSISVESEPGHGAVFTVRIPRGAAHLPADRVRAASDGGSSAARAGAYVEEALSWLPAGQAVEARRTGQRVLLADDNADLREYARRLLAEHYDVEAVADGEAALAAARARMPDLVVTDVMMPRLDGFGLIGALRADKTLRDTPVIALSARAGEEARFEGLGRGADDYVVKPFSARELLVRVETLLRSAGLRRQTERALREADARKDEFIAVLSHELRNPLAPLRNALEALRFSSAADAAAAGLLDMMERQVNHLVRLTDDLLEMSRITRGAFELRRERVELAAFVRNALETVDPLIRARNHQVTLALPEDTLWVDGDPVRLAQILANLLNNAARYTDKGGSIVVRAWREGASAAVAVRDNGAGIAPGQLTTLFDMFARGERSSGLGIGLALARRLAEMHGGTIGAASDGLGKGAEFTVRLPLAAAAKAERSTATFDTAALAPKRILVVDDNRDAADSLGVLLKFLGADVKVAHDGREALAAFEAHRPAVVLLDIGMPGMDGYEVARAIRSRADGGVPLVALTGWGQEEDRRRVREAGFNHHLVKPAGLDALRALLGSL
jgi:signal transduction histidine kinase